MIELHIAFVFLASPTKRDNFSTSDIINNLAEALEVFGNLPLTLRQGCSYLPLKCFQIPKVQGIP